jgi:hypothetical protein
VMLSFCMDTQFHELIRTGKVKLTNHSGEAVTRLSSVEET